MKLTNGKFLSVIASSLNVVVYYIRELIPFHVIDIDKVRSD